MHELERILEVRHIRELALRRNVRELDERLQACEDMLCDDKAGLQALRRERSRTSMVCGVLEKREMHRHNERLGELFARDAHLQSIIAQRIDEIGDLQRQRASLMDDLHQNLVGQEKLRMLLEDPYENLRGVR